MAPPATLAGLLAEFRGCFSASTFPVFCALACGLVAQSTRRTVCGMLVGARLSQVWSHHRAHRFFSHARWSPEAVSAILARLVVRLLVGADEAILVAVDDTLFARRGPNVHAASWFHDGSAKGQRKAGYGNNWVIAAIVVRLAFLDRPVALPVGFSLIRKGSDDASRLQAARRLTEALAVALPGRHINVVADSAYAGKALRGLPAEVTWTTRLRANAALYQLAPPPTGRRGRPKTKGAKLPPLASLAAHATFTPTTVTRYGLTASVRSRSSPACGTGSSALSGCRSSSSGTRQRPATTSRWSPPTSPPRQHRSSSATPPAGLPPIGASQMNRAGGDSGRRVRSTRAATVAPSCRTTPARRLVAGVEKHQTKRPGDRSWPPWS